MHWKSREATIPEDLCFVYGQYLADYLHDVEICQRFARENRELMAKILLERSGLTAVSAFHTVHNYIDTEERILRKGAIAAHKGELVLIPINMRDGIVLAVGKGNPEWNFSAPHGAGRILSRTAAKEQLDVEEYRREMAGIYSTSVNEAKKNQLPRQKKAAAFRFRGLRKSRKTASPQPPSSFSPRDPLCWARVGAPMALSSKRTGHRPFKAAMPGSNPAGVTTSEFPPHGSEMPVP